MIIFPCPISALIATIVAAAIVSAAMARIPLSPTQKDTDFIHISKRFISICVKSMAIQGAVPAEAAAASHQFWMPHYYYFSI
jgi:hypothetical protein